MKKNYTSSEALAIHGDVFFSKENGFEESVHHFFKNIDIDVFLKKKHLTVSEIGFGTGLNLMILIDYWKRHHFDSTLHFISFEKFPLKKEERHKWMVWDSLRPYLPILDRIADCGEGRIHRIFQENLTIDLVIGDVNETLPNWIGKSDVWFLDGYAPSKNPDCWNEKLMKTVFQKTNEGGCFATFTSAGFVKRNLESAGFKVQKKKGYGKKRESLVGFKEGKKEDVFPKILIQGDGLAGSSLVFHFSRKKIQSKIELKNLDLGASSNKIGLFKPHFAKTINRESIFWMQCFEYFVQNAEIPESIGRKSGILQEFDPENFKRYQKGIQNFDFEDCEFFENSIFFKTAGYLSPKKWCEFLAKNEDYDLKDPNVLIKALGSNSENWIQKVRGQTLEFDNAPDENPFMKKEYRVGDKNLGGIVGATFDRHNLDPNPREEESLFLKRFWPLEGGKDRVRFRAVTRDGFPVIGPVEDHFVFTGLGSRGILYSYFLGDVLSDWILGRPLCILKDVFDLVKSTRDSLKS